MRKFVLLLILLNIASIGLSNDLVTPEKTQAELFIKLLSAVDLPAKGTSSSFKIAIVYNPKYSNTQQDAMNFLEMFLLFKNKKIKGKSLNPELYAWYRFFNPYNPPPVPDALLIPRGNNLPMERIIKYAISHKIPTLTVEEQSVRDGVAFGVIWDDQEKPQILLNMSTLKKINIKPDIELLQIARLYY